MPLAIVTGTSRGLGRALAERLLAEGWTVHGFSREPDGWARPGFVAHAVDVGDPAAVRAAVAAVTADGATIDLLVNNAGVAAMNALLLTPPEVAAELMRVNYLGTFHCLQAAGKAMVRARRGRILNVTTVAVPLALEGEAAYVASKAAVEALTRVAARELGPHGVLVAAVGLGPVDTRLTRGVGAEPLARLNARIGRPAGTTVAEAADFLFRQAVDPGLVGGSIHYLAALH
jgi:3-oxoacyl-[acyl-carrier protein] reductase